MFPMTPLQSWSFILLVAAIIALLVWAFAGFGSQSPVTDDNDLDNNDQIIDAPDDDSVSKHQQLATRAPVPAPPTPAATPTLRVITGDLAQRDEPMLYDWARDGI